MNEQQKIGALEAMLFAHADPVEAALRADALRVEPEEAMHRFLPPRWRCCQSLPTTSLSPAALLSRSAAWIPRPS